MFDKKQGTSSFALLDVIRQKSRWRSRSNRELRAHCRGNLGIGTMREISPESVAWPIILGVNNLKLFKNESYPRGRSPSGQKPQAFGAKRGAGVRIGNI
jgi:hypothetical protein